MDFFGLTLLIWTSFGLIGTHLDSFRLIQLFQTLLDSFGLTLLIWTHPTHQDLFGVIWTHPTPSDSFGPNLLIQSHLDSLELIWTLLDSLYLFCVIWTHLTCSDSLSCHFGTIFATFDAFLQTSHIGSKFATIPATDKFMIW